MKPKGWRNESRRHSLASKGIKTKQKIPRMARVNPPNDPEDDKRKEIAKLRKNAEKLIQEKLGGKKVTIIGRRWFDSSGNTYHSSEVYVDGKFIGREPFEYGYDDAFKFTGLKILKEKGLAPKTGKNTLSGFKLDDSVFIDFMRNNRENFVISVTDVQRKKDL